MNPSVGHRKLVIQIPAYNEAETLGETLGALPKKIPGFDTVEILVIDDGSTDGTAEVAHHHGAHHVLRLPRNMGLARAFMSGLQASVERGASVIVNTDADNQYEAQDIESLTTPLVEGQFDVMVGTREMSQAKHFSPLKRMLQRLGSLVVRLASRTQIPDATSGFRAYTREAAMQLNVFNDYTYTIETLIQAGQIGLKVGWRGIRFRSVDRPSRLMKSTAHYIYRSTVIITRFALLYRPLVALLIPAFSFLLAGGLLLIRFAYYHFTQPSAGHVQSVIIGALFLGLALAFTLVAFLGDLIQMNRRHLEQISLRQKRMEAYFIQENREQKESRSQAA